MTYIKPTVLPFAHLFDIDACAKFVSDYIFYCPSEEAKSIGSKVGSPTLTLGNFKLIS